MLKKILILVFSLLINYVYTQNYFYTASGYCINKSTIENCHTDTAQLYPASVALDIAITPNGNLYVNGFNDTLYLVDYVNQQYLIVGRMTSANGINLHGTGLVGINDDFLLMDVGDSLYKVDVNTAIGTPIGKIGFYCNGDFAFFEDILYMIDSNGDLIKIVLNQTKTAIANVVNIGFVGSSYSLFTEFDCETEKHKLFTIIDNQIYTVNTQNANITYKCSLSTNFYPSGACSLSDFVVVNDTNILPNVFTPNNDGVNDNFKIITPTKNISEFHLSVFNRWGKIMYETNDKNFSWNGTIQSNIELSDGCYYYMAVYKNQCGTAKKIKNFVTIIR